MKSENYGKVCDKMREAMESKLVAVYKQWLNEVKETEPSLLGKNYSNPYYSSIPDSWFETAGPRILIVGEEGFGEWGCGKADGTIRADEIEKIQRLNYEYLKKQIVEQHAGNVNNSPFWNRFRRIAEFGVCAWTNIDKIHVLHSKKCALTQIERSKLHSVPTKILQEEIWLLNPTHVVFFGWHGESLRQELPELHARLYPNGPHDNSMWNQTVVPVTLGQQSYLFCYHPNWGYRKKGYEDEVLAAFKKLLENL